MNVSIYNAFNGLATPYVQGQRQDALRQKLVAEQEALRKLSARQTARDNNTEAAKHASALKVCSTQRGVFLVKPV